MNNSMIKQYLKAGRALQTKYNEIKTGLIDRENLLQEQYKPLIQPLREIGTQIETVSTTSQLAQPKAIEGLNYSQTIGPLATKFLGYYASKDVKTDTSFGLRTEDNKIFIGNAKVLVNGDDLVINNRYFNGTEGLWELLTLDRSANYTTEDLDHYCIIIQMSNAYLQNNDPNSTHVKSSSSHKYKKFIKPLVIAINEHRKRKREGERRASLNQSLNDELPRSALEDVDPQYKTGEGLTKVLTNTPVEYRRWNNIELLEQLYIDIGEIKAGNNSPYIRNDIVDILREIKEEFEL